MKMESSVNRRTFIKSAAILGGLSMVLGMFDSASARAKESVPVNPPGQPGKGYQLTEHVKKYYETARL